MCVVCSVRGACPPADESGCLDAPLAWALQPGNETGGGTASPVSPHPEATEIAGYLTDGYHQTWNAAGYFGLPRYTLTGDRTVTVSLDGIAAEARPLAEAALAAWSDVADLTFREAPAAQAQILFVDDSPGAFVRWRYDHGEARGTFVGATVNIFEGSIAKHGGGYGDWTYSAYVHEVGHALGLGHPGAYTSFADAAGGGRIFDADSEIVSVMSYFRHDGATHMFGSRAWPVTPQLADILAVRSLYGAAEGVRTGDDVYGHGTTATGPLAALAGDVPVIATIVDGGGHDLLNYAPSRHDLTLDLRPGAASDVDGMAGAVTLGPDTWIEDAAAGAGADWLIGNARDNVLMGGSGDDTMQGGAGNDVLDGGAGNDTAVFAEGFGGYVLRLSGDGIEVADKRTDGEGRDLLRDVEYLRFGDGVSFEAEGAVRVSALSGILDLTPQEIETFVRMYVAYFDRAPDALGLAFWADKLAKGMAMDEIAAAFFDQAETRAIFGAAEDAGALVDLAYTHLLERAPDAAGRDWWAERLESGEVDRADFMLALAEGTEHGLSDDARTIADKAQIGTAYALARGLTDNGNARAAMAAYATDARDDSLAAAHALIETFASAARAAESGEVVVELAGIPDDPLAWAI